MDLYNQLAAVRQRCEETDNIWVECKQQAMTHAPLHRVLLPMMSNKTDQLLDFDTLDISY